MGYDEHGPAYPEPPYRCPICGGNENRYLTCEYPGCMDGRDAGHPHARLIKKYGPAYGDPYQDTMPNRLRGLIGWAAFLALLVYLMWPHGM